MIENSKGTIRPSISLSRTPSLSLSDLRNKIDEVKQKLPSDAEDPDLTEIDSTMQAIFNVNLT